MRCYGFGFAGALEHEELGEDGDGFEPDGESPEDLEVCVVKEGNLFVGRERVGGELVVWDGGTYFCDLVFVREEDSENGAAAE